MFVTHRFWSGAVCKCIVVAKGMHSISPTDWAAFMSIHLLIKPVLPSLLCSNLA